jgi:hypothetical protein
VTDRPTPGKRRRKPYAKPEVNEVELRPEEAVLGSCKKTSAVGPLQAQCNTPSNCSTIAS